MMKLHGSITALATPFRGGAVDEKAFERLVDWQIKEGTHGLVINGTTGEAPTLTETEQDRLVEMAVAVAASRIPVIAGTGSNNTAHVIHRTQAAQKLGAAAALVVSPYYNKPTQEGLYQHFKAVHDANQLPILVYNIPGRCVVDILPPTMQKIAALPRVVGVKDATGDVSRPVRTRLDCGSDFIQFSGDDALNCAFLSHGAVGAISVASNVAPRLCAELQNAWAKGDLTACFAIRDRLAPLNQALFAECSPQPVKYGLSLLGFGTDEMRLPLIPCSEPVRKQVSAAMEALGLLKAKAA
jgi:4-hydroxy-tetrahydrodipicolinate synthase